MKMDDASREKGQQAIDAIVSCIIKERAGWLEDIAAGLIINGLRPDEVEIQEHPDGRTVVAVRGVPKYEFRPSVQPPVSDTET